MISIALFRPQGISLSQSQVYFLDSRGEKERVKSEDHKELVFNFIYF